MRRGTRRERRSLLVADMYPFDLALAAKRVRHSVEAITDDAVNPLDTSCDEDFDELISNRLHDLTPPEREAVSR
jgi:hypothetical protein